jgi:hypothetical protein
MGFFGVKLKPQVSQYKLFLSDIYVSVLMRGFVALVLHHKTKDTDE